jgi:hypothetical protein
MLSQLVNTFDVHQNVTGALVANGFSIGKYTLSLLPSRFRSEKGWITVHL